MSVAIFLSASVSLARFVEPSVSFYVVVTVCRPFMNTMRLSWVSCLQSERLNDTLKFGFPVTSVSAMHALKHIEVFVAFWPKPVGRPSETSDTHAEKQLPIFVAFWPKPAGSERDVNVKQYEKQY